MKKLAYASMIFAFGMALQPGTASPAPAPAQAEASSQSQQASGMNPGLYVLRIQSGQVNRMGPLGPYDSVPLTAWSPDSTNLAMALSNPDTGGGGLQVASVSSGRTTQVLMPDAGRVSGLHWSPDGARLAYAFTGAVGTPNADKLTLNIWDSAANTSRTLPTGGSTFAWTPDGTGITLINQRATPSDPFAPRIITVDADGGAVTATVLDSPLAGCQLGLAWSADGAYLAYAGHGFHEGCVVPPSDLGVYAWEAATGTIRQLYSGTATAPAWSADGRVLAEVVQPDALNGISQNPISLQSFGPDGSGQRTIASGLPNSFPYPDPPFQAAGDTVMYATATCQGAAAWAVHPQGSSPVNITSPSQYALSPHLAPDGLSIAFSRIGSVGADLVLTRTDLSQAITPVIGAAGIHVLDFSPDGASLAFAVTSQTFDLCAMP